MITVALVRTGDKFPVAYVEKLAAGIRRHLHVEHEILCLTDRPDDVVPGVSNWDISGYGLTAWWAKMLLFHRAIPARGERILYFDLDTIITGDLSALAAYDGALGVCANFTKRAGDPLWPCNYGSCVMSFPTGAHHKTIWEPFWAAREEMIHEAGKFGDQWTLEMLAPGADLLQDLLPARTLMHFKRDLKREPPPPETAVLVFGGWPKPHEAKEPWAAQLWAAA